MAVIIIFISDEIAEIIGIVERNLDKNTLKQSPFIYTHT